MEEIGVVKEINGVSAIVAVTKKTSCDHCTDGAGKCHSKGDEMLIDALNIVKAEVGQRVKVTAKPLTYLQGTLLIYAFPALSLIVGAILGKKYLSMFIINPDLDVMSAIGGFSALIISLVIAKIVSSRLDKKTEYKPVIDEIIEDDE
jgi:sigma-E factor negative regulatory protein RseC